MITEGCDNAVAPGGVDGGSWHHDGMTSIGVVLGAGGVVGAAFHAGALDALAEVTGWDARTAALLVGTSAGSGVSASLRVGFSPADLFARSLGRTLSREGRALGASVGDGSVQIPPAPGWAPLSFLRPAAPWLAAVSFLAPGPVRPGLLAGWLPRGTVSTGFLGERIRALGRERERAGAWTDRRWPDAPTWICATRMRDGKRVVLGRADVDTDIGTAVEASSAVPGFFAPVSIGGHDHFDGGTFSPTNADLVAGLGFDLVIVISPMSAVSAALGPAVPFELDDGVGAALVTGIGRSVDLGGRRLNAMTLAREVKAIRASGTPVLVLQPTAADLEVMRGNPLDSAMAAPVARQARASVAAFLTSAEAQDRVDVLRRAAADTHAGDASGQRPGQGPAPR